MTVCSDIKLKDKRSNRVDIFPNCGIRQGTKIKSEIKYREVRARGKPPCS
jgi:competence protein ComGF